MINIIIIIITAINYKNLIIDFGNLEKQIEIQQADNKNLEQKLKALSNNEYADDIDLLKQKSKVNALINSLPGLKNTPQQSNNTGELHYATGSLVNILLLSFKLVNSNDVITHLDSISIQDDKAALSYEIYGTYKK
jgi:hypothetical protein